MPGRLRTSVLLVAVAWALLAGCGGDAPPAPFLAADEFAVIVHRGASARAPENTLPAFERALQLDVDWAEVDVRRTRDGVLVVLHDRSLARTTNVEEVFPGGEPWHVEQYTLEQVKRLDAGSWFDEAFAGVEVPMVREVLDLVANRMGLLFHLKAPARYDGIEAQLAELLDEYPGYLDAAQRDGEAAVMSLDEDALQRYHALQPDTPLGVVYDRTPSEPELEAVRGYASAVFPQAPFVDAAVVDHAHDFGLDVVPYTTNQREHMRQLLALGVDGMITNRPAVLLELLAERTAQP